MVEFATLLLVAAFFLSARAAIVEIEEGRILGSELKTNNGKSYHAFQGVPFAESPVGKLRFLHPVPKKPWKDTFEANKRVICPQYNSFTDEVVLNSEDCLVVNVYTPELPAKESPKLPVMVFIHGGGYIAGDGTPSLYGPDHFMGKDVVLVTMNYRVGPFGFLSMSDDVMPGNMGLWDQHLALQWVRKNIHVFGGDPMRVTLFGESAGGMSAMYHFLSPQSTGLFHAVIAQSGVASSTFNRLDKNPAYYTRTIAQHVGCNPKATSKQILSCLQKTDLESLVSSGEIFFEFSDMAPIVFKPVVDSYASKPFIEVDPLTAIYERHFNQVPIIIGANEHEGVIFTDPLAKPELLKQLQDDWENKFPLLALNREASSMGPKEIEFAKDVLQKQFNGVKPRDPPDGPGFEKLTQILGDAHFTAIGPLVAKRIARRSKAPVFEYIYTHKGSLSLADILSGSQIRLFARIITSLFGIDPFGTERKTVAHCDELFLMFKPDGLDSLALLTEDDKKASENLVRLWTNFAKHLHPTPAHDQEVKWESVDSDAPQRMNISSSLNFGPHPEEMSERIQFWAEWWLQFPPRIHLARDKTSKRPDMFKDLTQTTKAKEEL